MNVKPSYYNVYSDCLNEDREYAVFNSITAKSILISENIYLALSGNAPETLPNDVLEKLGKAGFVVPENKNEFLEVIGENKQASGSGSTLYEAIQPTANCQLGCYYCGQSHTKHNISNSMANQLIDRVKKRLALRPNLKRLSIGWFGGEPLIALDQIRYISKELMAHCEQHHLEYDAKMTSNGMSLTIPVYRELVALKVNRVEITLDGTEDAHNSHRFVKDGSGSFARIFNNLLALFASPYFEPQKTGIAIRCNVDERNIDNIPDLINLLYEHRVHEKISVFYTVPIYSWGGNDAHQQTPAKQEYARREMEWVRTMKNLGFPVRLLPKRKKVVCLSLDKNAELTDPYGNLYNCTETSLSPVYENSTENYITGHVSRSPVFEEPTDVLSNWYHLLEQEDGYQCKRCPVLPVCGGSCPKSWLEGMNACPPFKFNLKERLALLYTESRVPAK